MDDLLKGIKVLELASVLAGPTVGTFLAELGATVIKVENPNTQGDSTRKWKLPTEDSEATTSAYFASANWGKEHLFIDVSSATGNQEVIGLVKQSDIVLVNYKPGSAAKLGMDYESLKAINPTLIYANITGYGEGDSRPAFDAVVQAGSGFMSMNGTTESGPLKMPVALMDILAAHQIKQGILLALFKREKTGEGSEVQCNLLQAGISALANQASNWLMEGHLPQPIGNLHPNIAPYGEIIIAKDGKAILLAVGTDQQFQSLCTILGQPNLANKSAYQTNIERVKNRIQLLKELINLAQNIDSTSLIDQLNQLKVPASPILNMPEVFEQPLAKEMVLEDEVGKRTKQVAFTIK